jgi:hypothetical protein
VRQSLLAIGILLAIVLCPRLGEAEDLGIVRVVTRPEPGKPSGHFTATHLGHGILLTCGHCCRYAGGPGIAVDVHVLSLAERTSYRTEPATVLCLDEAADLGLIRLDRPASLPIAYVLAPRDHSIGVGQHVLQYTWQTPGGSVLHSLVSEITTVNMFAGAANLETRHASVQGDSGAPLVCREDGMIIGVTTGADSWGRFAVHTGLKPIHDLLQRCNVQVPTSRSAQFERVQPVSLQAPVRQ